MKITILLAFFGFAYGIGNMVTPEMYREMSPGKLGYVFVPDDDTFVKTNHYLEIRFVQMGPEAPLAATAWISRSPDEAPQALEFEPAIYRGKETDKWFAILPPLDKIGSRWFYYIMIETSEGRTIEIWKSMNRLEKLFSGFEKDRQLFWTTYEGNVVRDMPYGKAALVTHIVFSFGALLFLFHTLYYALSILDKPGSLAFIKCFRSSFWALLIFAVGAIVLGIPITWYTFGVGFSPWPTQGLTSLGDITDTKSSWLVVWWTVLLIRYFRTYRGALGAEIEPAKTRAFAIWTIVALLVTVFVFLIPHSQFLQSS